MNKRLLYIVLALIAALWCGVETYGQQAPERKHIRRGNSLYEQQRMAEAEQSYLEALQRDSLSVEAAFNRGDAHYAKGDFAAAEESFQALVDRPAGKVSDQVKASAYYNLGNAQFQQQKLQEALESYKSSLRLNPSDLEAKFNYAYTKALLEEQQNQEQNQNQNQNQQGDQEQNQDNQQQDNQQNQDNQQQQDQNQQGDQEQQNEQGQNQQEEKPEASDDAQQQPQQGPSEESEQILNAIQQAEDNTREKVDEQRAVGVAPSGKNW